jgi:hypothetical protein
VTWKIEYLFYNTSARKRPFSRFSTVFSGSNQMTITSYVFCVPPEHSVAFSTVVLLRHHPVAQNRLWLSSCLPLSRENCALKAAFRRFPAPVQPLHRTGAPSRVSPSGCSGRMTREEISKTSFFRSLTTRPLIWGSGGRTLETCLHADLFACAPLCDNLRELSEARYSERCR